jgi:hypothetical protein
MNLSFLIQNTGPRLVLDYLNEFGENAEFAPRRGRTVRGPESSESGAIDL